MRDLARIAHEPHPRASHEPHMSLKSLARRLIIELHDLQNSKIFQNKCTPNKNCKTLEIGTSELQTFGIWVGRDADHRCYSSYSCCVNTKNIEHWFPNSAHASWNSKNILHSRLNPLWTSYLATSNPLMVTDLRLWLIHGTTYRWWLYHSLANCDWWQLSTNNSTKTINNKRGNK